MTHYWDHMPKNTDQHDWDNCSCCQAWVKVMDGAIEAEGDHKDKWTQLTTELVEAIEDENDDNYERLFRALHNMKHWLGHYDYLTDRIYDIRGKQ
jgi:hypothetical protein